MLLFSVLATDYAARGQAVSAVERSDAGMFVTVGGGNTQFPSYADNALGVNFGLFYQRRVLLGAELRGGTYPVKARYSLTPVTVGYRVGKIPDEGRHDLGWSPFTLRHLVPFGYIGGGFSHAQDSGYAWQNPPLAAKWVPCWQASIGVDRSYRFVTWRIAEISWTKTYTALHDLRTPYASTGLVLRFGR